MKKFTSLMILVLAVVQLSFTQVEKTIKDADLNGSATWFKDTVYVLDGFVFLEEGTLTIQPGTVIKGKGLPSTGDNASALIITTDAKINAVGSPQSPIIFTAEDDDVNDATDLTYQDRGLWGGLILLGNAQLGFSTETAQIEGIPTEEVRAQFGGQDDAHNSGVLKYVSIRHGGAELAPGNEINGLTMGGVGSETVIEHVEVFGNDDDGFEWFGGTVSCRWLVSAFNKDDAFDYDFGWRGKGQFWFVIQGTDKADNAGEHDGAKPDDATPYSNPQIYNVTYIGAGKDATGEDLKNETALYLRDNSAGTYANSIFTDFANDAIEVEDLESGVDSRQQMEDGNLVLKNNIWFGFGSGDNLVAGEMIRVTEGAPDADGQFLIDHLTNNNNQVVDPMLRGISRDTDGGLDPRPKAGSPALNAANAADLPDDWYKPANYVGAFGYTNWAAQWSAVDAYGFFGSLPFGGTGEEVIITDADLSGDAHWTADKTYILDGFVFLEEGTLTIDPGTVIKGKALPTSGDNASALIITANAQIMAEGTPILPIIFTAEDDDITDNTDLTFQDRGLWGGLILLGNAQLGFSTETAQIEGIPTTEARTKFGGDDDEDNSGVLRYVSIRHGGAELAPGNEINGLTMGGVGSETVIEHIEVFGNDDDGFEWFGGTVGCKWLVSAFNKDDAFDYDFGWRGKGQFWFVIQGTDKADNGGEHDGAKPDDATPYSNPLIYNATYIGAGKDATGEDLKNETALYLRDNSAGTYANSIFTDFANDAIEVEDLASGVDSRKQMEDGNLVLKNNLWFGFGSGDNLVAGEMIRVTDGAEDANAQFLIDHLTNNNNQVVDPMLRGISRATDAGLDPRPKAGSPALDAANAADLPDDWYTDANYVGAFGYSNWATQWTAVDAYGFFGDLSGGFGENEVIVTDASLSGDARWTADNTYLLDGFVFLEEGTLTIDAGTVIKGKALPSSGDNASALIITTNARINAVGDVDAPIIFTAEDDDVTDPGDLTSQDRGLWGGLILLGKASLGFSTETAQVEGIPTNESRAQFGGTDDAHNSGTLKYISIRHGGAELAPGNEINGLTMGGVGSETVIENVEVFANDDDGFEWFGGTVGGKWLISSFNKDDAFDYDFGWRGKGQFWFVIQGTDKADNGGEHDGAKPDDATPYSQPVIYNATYIGSGKDATGEDLKNETAIYLRDNSAGTYANSIFTDFANNAIEVEDLESGVDSRQQMEDGNLVIKNNIWFGFGAGDNLVAGEMIRVTDGAPDADGQFLIDHLTNNNNYVEDPGLYINREPVGELDPRPDFDSPARTNEAADVPADDFYTDVDYIGAFEVDNWALGWSVLDHMGYFGDIAEVINSVESLNASGNVTMRQNYPNPFSVYTNIEYSLPTNTTVNLVVYDITGKVVKVLVNNERKAAGTHNLQVTDLQSGTYFYKLDANGQSIINKMVVLK